MTLPADVLAAMEKMHQSEAALRADVESVEPYSKERRNRLLREVKKATDEYLEKVARLR